MAEEQQLRKLNGTAWCMYISINIYQKRKVGNGIERPDEARLGDAGVVDGQDRRRHNGTHQPARDAK